MNQYASGFVQPGYGQTGYAQVGYAQPAYASQNEYYVEPVKRRKKRPFFKTWTGYFVIACIVAIVIYILYNYACDWPIINLLCGIFKSVFKVFGFLAKILNFIT